MNKVELMGRPTRDPVIRFSQGDKPMAVARYTLAVNRKYKREGEPEADFLNCIAFGKNAEFVEKWIRQGVKIVIVGHLQTGNYTNKDGVKVYTTDVVVEEHHFAESRASEGNVIPATASDIGDGFMNIPDGIDEELPFS